MKRLGFRSFSMKHNKNPVERRGNKAERQRRDEMPYYQVTYKDEDGDSKTTKLRADKKQDAEDIVYFRGEAYRILSCHRISQSKYYYD